MGFNTFTAMSRSNALSRPLITLAYPPAPWIPESKVNRFASSNVLFTAPLHRLAMEVSLLLVLRVRARI